METINQNLKVETLRFGYGETKLGLVLVALSDCGVAAILLGDDRRKLWRELSDSLPGTQLVEDNAGLAKAIAKVVTLINAPWWFRLSARSPWLGAGASSMDGAAGDPAG